MTCTHNWLISALTIGLLTGSAAAAEYFVDCNRPDDSGDGLTEVTAKRTIQAAIDLTNPQGSDTVTVLPGVYTNGVRKSPAYSDDYFRVVITNHCILRSRDGAAKTIVKGGFGSGENRQGTGAVRGIFMNGIAYAVVEGFTITGCATAYTGSNGSKHYGAAVVGNWNNYLLGCVVSNNYAYSAAGTHLVNAIRCLIVDNWAQNNVVGVNGYYFNYIISRNRSSESPLGYAKAVVNCTCIDNQGVLFNSSSANIYNSVLLMSSGVGQPGYTELHACVTDAPSSQFKSVDGNTVCDVSKYQHVAPAFGDFRLQSDSAARGIASKSDYQAKLDGQKLKYSVTTALKNPQWVLDKYELKDFAGNDMGESLDAGALQGGVAVAGAPIEFVTPGFCGEDWNVPGGSGSYAYSTTWPSVVSCRFVSSDSKLAFFCTSTGTYGKVTYHYPTLDGRFVFAPPPHGGTMKVTGFPAQQVYYVDDDGSDGCDGTDRDHPFKTLQKAYDTATGNYTYVIVAPGIYDEGGTEVNGVTNRLNCDNKSIQFVAEKGPGETFVVGAADQGSTMGGIGGAAVRCVRWRTTHNEAAMRGFTFTDGHSAAVNVTSPNTWSSVEANQGGAVYIDTDASAGDVHFLDCVFSNNVALIAAVNQHGVFTRCRFYGNHTVNPSGSIGRNGYYRYCEFRDNVEQNYTLDNSVQHLHFCSVRGRVAVMQSDIYASLLTEMDGSGSTEISRNVDFAGNLVNGAVITRQQGTTGEFSYISDDAKLIGYAGGDLRFLADSPAVGAAAVVDMNKLMAVATEDLDGHGMHVRNGVPTIGAHQYPMQAICVDGPKGSVTVVGGNIGTNAVDAGESLTIVADPLRKNQSFLGWMVDGVMIPGGDPTYVYNAPTDPDLTVPTVSACYPRPGLLLQLR